MLKFILLNKNPYFVNNQWFNIRFMCVFLHDNWCYFVLKVYCIYKLFCLPFWRFNIVAPYEYMTENVKSELDIKHIFLWNLLLLLFILIYKFKSYRIAFTNKREISLRLLKRWFPSKEILNVREIKHWTNVFHKIKYSKETTKL